MTASYDGDLFLSIFSEYFDIDRDELEFESDLASIGFDSIMFLEIALLLEEESGEEVPPELMASLRTVGDVYHFYTTYRSRAGNGEER